VRGKAIEVSESEDLPELFFIELSGLKARELKVMQNA